MHESARVLLFFCFYKCMCCARTSAVNLSFSVCVWPATLSKSQSDAQALLIISSSALRRCRPDVNHVTAVGDIVYIIKLPFSTASCLYPNKTRPVKLKRNKICCKKAKFAANFKQNVAPAYGIISSREENNVWTLHYVSVSYRRHTRPGRAYQVDWEWIEISLVCFRSSIQGVIIEICVAEESKEWNEMLKREK